MVKALIGTIMRNMHACVMCHTLRDNNKVMYETIAMTIHCSKRKKVKVSGLTTQRVLATTQKCSTEGLNGIFSDDFICYQYTNSFVVVHLLPRDIIKIS